MSNPSYVKGAKFERAIRDALGNCTRSFMSGAYTGDVDLRWTVNGRIWNASCKIKGDGFKFDYAELDKADILFKRADRQPALVTMHLSKFLELVGQTQAREME